MKKFAFFLSLAIFGLMAFKPGDELAIGGAIPKSDVVLKDVSGKDITLASAKTANGLLVMFSCNTCPYVIKNQDRTKEILGYAAKNGIGVVILNSNEANRTGDDSFDAMKTYAKDQGYTWNYAVDANSVVADAFGANRTPECYLFGKDGKLAYHGAIDDSPNDAAAVQKKHLKTALDEVAAGKAVTVQTSRSVGCSIKRKA